MRKTIVALAFGMFAVAGVAQAADLTNFYGGVEGTKTFLRDDWLARDGSYGVSAFGGYNINHTFSVQTSISDTEDFQDVLGGKARVFAVEGDVLAGYDVGYGLRPFVKVGLAAQRLENEGASSSGVNPVVGIGVDYTLTKHVAFRVDGQYSPRVADVRDNLFTMGAGLKFNF